MNVLLDSGSQISLAREDMIPHLADFQPCILGLCLVDGSPLKVFGTGMLNATIQGVPISQVIHVVNGM